VLWPCRGLLILHVISMPVGPGSFFGRVACRRPDVPPRASSKLRELAKLLYSQHLGARPASLVERSGFRFLCTCVRPAEPRKPTIHTRGPVGRPLPSTTETTTTGHQTATRHAHRSTASLTQPDPYPRLHVHHMHNCLSTAGTAALPPHRRH
jgi:hypothetical protein